MVGFPMPSGLKRVLWTLGSLPGVIANGWVACSMGDHLSEADWSMIHVVTKWESQMRIPDGGFPSVHAMVWCHKLQQTYLCGLDLVNCRSLTPIYSRSHWIIRVPYFLWLNILISGNTRSHSTRTFCWLNVSWRHWFIVILSLTHHCAISAPSPRNAHLSIWYWGTNPWH